MEPEVQRHELRDTFDHVVRIAEGAQPLLRHVCALLGLQLPVAADNLNVLAPISPFVRRRVDHFYSPCM